MFIALLFIITKIWKQPKYPSVDKWISKTVAPLHNGILLGYKKEGNLNFGNSMDGPGEYYVK